MMLDYKCEPLTDSGHGTFLQQVQLGPIKCQGELVLRMQRGVNGRQTQKAV